MTDLLKFGKNDRYDQNRMFVDDRCFTYGQMRVKAAIGCLIIFSYFNKVVTTMTRTTKIKTTAAATTTITTTSNKKYKI
jgi:hypothetical protein